MHNNLYEKALLEYERYKRQNGGLQFSPAAPPEASNEDNDANGYNGPELSGRARREAACEVGIEPAIKDKNNNDMPKHEKSLKSKVTFPFPIYPMILGRRSIGLYLAAIDRLIKHKRPSKMENAINAARTEIGKQLVITVEDVGPPAKWVKINVIETKDCFEVYALVPGLLDEEIKVQTDPAGRLVITGQPNEPDNPWGVTPFKKVVNFHTRIDPLQTSAVIRLYGRLYVRVLFDLGAVYSE